jgi:hypothetical protein
MSYTLDTVVVIPTVHEWVAAFVKLASPSQINLGPLMYPTQNDLKLVSGNDAAINLNDLVLV